jgi:hypothetical protein
MCRARSFVNLLEHIIVLWTWWESRWYHIYIWTLMSKRLLIDFFFQSAQTFFVFSNWLILWWLLNWTSEKSDDSTFSFNNEIQSIKNRDVSVLNFSFDLNVLVQWKKQSSMIRVWTLMSRLLHKSVFEILCSWLFNRKRVSSFNDFALIQMIDWRLERFY